MNKEKIRNTILRLYEYDPDIVNDRTKLLAKVWREFGWNNLYSLETNLSRVPSAESVSRRLRDLHQEGLIKYSDDELERRTDAFNNEREAHSSNEAVFVGLDRKK